MSPRSLHVFALNMESTLRHTNLTRATGDAIELPPLAEWLGIPAIDENEIELFPLKDLGDMPLSDYISRAYDPENALPTAVAGRLDALTGSVLLVPDGADSGPMQPGVEVTLVATIPLAQPDNAAHIRKADLSPSAGRRDRTSEPVNMARRGAIGLLLALLVLGLLILLFGALT